MLANAKLQRMQYERKLLHEANSLRAALKSELNANLQAFEGRIEQFNEPTEYDDALIQNRFDDKIFNELLSEIGLLTEQEIEKIIGAYGLLCEVPYRLRILVGTDKIGGFNDEFIRVTKNHQNLVTDMHKVAIPIIKQAIDTINVHLKPA
jgi:hypothetical protein